MQEESKDEENEWQEASQRLLAATTTTTTASPTTRELAAEGAVDTSYCRRPREDESDTPVSFHPGTFPRAPASQLTRRRVLRARRVNRSSPISSSSTRLFSSSTTAAVQETVNENSNEKEEEPMPPLFDISNNQNGHHEQDGNNGEDEQDDEEESEYEQNDSDDEDESSDEEEESSSEEEEDEEEDDESECMCATCLFNKAVRGLEEREAENDNDVIDLANAEGMCCVCFEYSSRIVTLDCCGSNNREATTSTRFCTHCIFKCLASQNNVSHHVDMEDFRGRLVGECPRCRSLVCIKRLMPWSPPMFQPPYLVKKATYQEAISHASSLDEEMRSLMYACAFCYPKFIPIELLEDREEKARQLVRWGILKQVRENKLYSIDPLTQLVLRDAVKGQMDRDDNEHGFAAPFLMPLPCKLLGGAWRAICKFKVYTAMRLTNQAIATLFVCVGGLPDIPDKMWWQGAIVACLNFTLVTLAIQVIFLAVGYLIFTYVSVVTVGTLLKTTRHAGWKMWLRYAAAAGLGVAGFMFHAGGRPLVTGAIVWGTSTSWLLPKHANMMPNWLILGCKYLGSFLLLLQGALMLYRHVWGNADERMHVDEIMEATEFDSADKIV